MNRIDPDNIVVLVRDSSDNVVRIGTSNWRELCEVVRSSQADDMRRTAEINAQVSRALSTGVMSS